MFKKIVNKGRILLLSVSLMAMSAVTAFADVTTPTSMLDTEAKGIIQDFGADIVPTVLDLVKILVPVGLTLWGIGFAVRKGIGFLQRRANSSLK